MAKDPVEVTEDDLVKPRIGDRLVDAGLVSRENAETFAAVHDSEGTRLGEKLLAAKLIEERDLYEHLSAQTGLRLANLKEVLRETDPALFRKLPIRFLEKKHLLPVKLVDGVLTIVTSETNVDATELSLALGNREVERLLATPSDLRRMRLALELGQVGQARKLAHHAIVDLESHTDLDATLIALFNAILGEAIGERASDIHLERYGESVRVRMRIDGDLLDMPHYRLTPEQHLGIVNVVKVKANLDISERRVPQGGRFTTAAGKHIYDLRVQTQPSLHGEHLVIRILAQDTRVIEIGELGFPPQLAKAYRRLLDSPGGLVLVVGPTGSGKSTTLYAGLQILAKDTTRKVVTIEDPIEYAIDNVQQAQVNPEVGFQFSNAMRAFVREDPDVILLGEIRDSETALEAMRASQTGHLVLSTLHCNDSVDAVQRLLDLGINANSVASELIAVFAQRLAPRICASCRCETSPDPALLAEVFSRGVPAGFKAFKGSGCPHCEGRGTYGRIAVVEYLPASVRLRIGISRRLPIDELRVEARIAGVQPMRTQALELVTQGVIPFECLPALLSFEQLSDRGEQASTTAS